MDYKYAKGARVKLIEADYLDKAEGLEVGDIGTVIVAETKNDCASVKWDGKGTHLAVESQLEPYIEVPKPTFKVGDRVKLVSVALFHIKRHGLQRGDVGTITKVDDDLAWVVFRDTETAWCLLHRLEHVKEVPKPTFKVGDRVELINADGGQDKLGLRVGDIGTVNVVDGVHANYPRVIWDRLNKYGCKIPCVIDVKRLKPYIEHPEVLYPSNEFLIGVEITKIVYNNPRTIVFIKDRRGKSHKSVALCHHNDVYDKDAGVVIAVLKWMQQAIPGMIEDASKSDTRELLYQDRGDVEECLK